MGRLRPLQEASKKPRNMTQCQKTETSKLHECAYMIKYRSRILGKGEYMSTRRDKQDE